MIDVNKLTDKQKEIINGWWEDGASCACRDIDDAIDLILCPYQDVSDEYRLRLLQSLAAIKHELQAFDVESDEMNNADEQKGGES